MRLSCGTLAYVAPEVRFACWWKIWPTYGSANHPVTSRFKMVYNQENWGYWGLYVYDSLYLIIVIDFMEQLLTGAHHLMTFRNTSPDVLEGAGSELYLSVRPVEPRSGGPAFHGIYGIWLNSSRKNDPQKDFENFWWKYLNSWED